MPSGEVALFGGAGEEAACADVADWIAGGMASDSRPKFEPDSLTGIVVRSQGAFRFDSRLRMFPLIEKFHAVGNGRDFAIAAMHLGKTALQAVEIAALFDVYTAAPFTSVSLDEP